MNTPGCDHTAALQIDEARLLVQLVNGFNASERSAANTAVKFSFGLRESDARTHGEYFKFAVSNNASVVRNVIRFPGPNEMSIIGASLGFQGLENPRDCHLWAMPSADGSCRHLPDRSGTAHVDGVAFIHNRAMNSSVQFPLFLLHRAQARKREEIRSIADQVMDLHDNGAFSAASLLFLRTAAELLNKECTKPLDDFFLELANKHTRSDDRSLARLHNAIALSAVVKNDLPARAKLLDLYHRLMVDRFGQDRADQVSLPLR